MVDLLCCQLILLHNPLCHEFSVKSTDDPLMIHWCTAITLGDPSLGVMWSLLFPHGFSRYMLQFIGSCNALYNKLVHSLSRLCLVSADIEVGCPSQNMQKHFPTIYLASDIKSFARASQASISKYAVPTSQYLPPDLQIAVATFCAIPPTCGRSNIYANVYVFTFPSRDHLHTDTALEKRYRSFGHCP